MQKLLCVLAAFAVATTGIAQNKSAMKVADNHLTPLEKSTGWKLLFDGNSTAGWHGYGTEAVGEGWKVADGMIMLSPDKNIKDRRGNDLVTDEEYADFDLKFDWKISLKGNSGVLFYIHEDSPKYHETYNTGMEMQVLDNGTPIRPGHPDARLYSHRAGDLYDLLAAKEAVHPQGEWNHAEIMSKKGKLDFYLNGIHTLSTMLWDDHWKQMLAISKFKEMAGFGTFKTGKISLQDHGNEVSFKNIKIKML